MFINSQNDAIELFCSAAIRHAEATESGDYRSCNKAYDRIIQALRWLETHEGADQLCSLLGSPDIGIQLWTATFLLFYGHPDAEKTLATLATRPSLNGFSASVTLTEWQAGRLRPLTA